MRVGFLAILAITIIVTVLAAIAQADEPLAPTTRPGDAMSLYPVPEPAMAEQPDLDSLQARSASEPLTLSNNAYAREPYDPEKLYFTARLGGWLLSLSGDVGVRDYSTDVHVSFDELIKHANIAVFPEFTLSKGNWLFAFHSMYAHLSDSEHFTGPLGIDRGADVSSNIAVLDGGIGYTIVRGQTTTGNSFTLTPAIGGRWTYVSLDIDPEVLRSRSNSRNWFDPYVGLQGTVGLTKDIDWETSGTIGGFGVGSRFTWTVQTMLEWHFSKHVALDVGYRALAWDYDEDNFKWDVTLQGPWIGISINN